MKKKPILEIEVKIKGEVYDRVYGIEDIKNVIALFNDVHGPQMRVKIVTVKEKRWK